MDTDATPTTISSGAAGPDDTEVLDESQSCSLPHEPFSGLLGVVVGGRPTFFSGKHDADHGSVFFRSATGSKIVASVGATARPRGQGQH